MNPRSSVPRHREARSAVAIQPPPRIAARRVGKDSPNWRYRVGDYRIVVRFEDRRLVILVVRVANRREAYR